MSIIYFSICLYYITRSYNNKLLESIWQQLRIKDK